METLQEKLTRLCSEDSQETDSVVKIDNFDTILSIMSSLYHNKNHDYGNSFEKSCNEFGLISPIIRMSDKLNRLKTLSKTSPVIGDEKIEDTLLDLANYAVMTLVWLKEQ